MDPALPGAGLGDYELKLFTTPNRMQNVCHTNVSTEIPLRRARDEAAPLVECALIHSGVSAPTDL